MIKTTWNFGQDCNPHRFFTDADLFGVTGFWKSPVTEQCCDELLKIVTEIELFQDSELKFGHFLGCWQKSVNNSTSDLKMSLAWYVVPSANTN